MHAGAEKRKSGKRRKREKDGRMFGEKRERRLGKTFVGQPQPHGSGLEADEDGTSSDEDDDGQAVQKDGTLQVNDPNPKPLRELNRKGPGRPLPPTPDDDDTIRRANAAAAQGHSPALANNRVSGLQQPV